MSAIDSCVLKLDRLVFDEVSFLRKGFKNDNRLNFEFGFNFEMRDNGVFVTHVQVKGTKEDEYTFSVCASGFFWMDQTVEDRDLIIRQNTVAIVFPYIRRQITTLTAQPEVEPIVLPPVNIAQMVESAMKSEKKQGAK